MWRLFPLFDGFYLPRPQKTSVTIVVKNMRWDEGGVTVITKSDVGYILDRPEK